jgi:hypothetical protein
MEQPDDQPGRLGSTNSEQLPAAGRSATPMANSEQLMEQSGDQPGRLGAPTPNNKMVHSRVIGRGLEGPGSLRSGLGLHFSPTLQQPSTALRSAGWLRVEGRRRTTTSSRQTSLDYDVGLLDSCQKHHRWQPAKLPRTVVEEGCGLNSSQPPPQAAVS